MTHIQSFTAKNDLPSANALERLFTDLYDHMASKGLSHPLVADGAAIWLRSMMPMLGKLTFIHLAIVDEKPQGFVAGTLRSLPPYVGGSRVGALTHIHVSESLRGSGVGKRLLQALNVSFREKGVSIMETDVLVSNQGSLDFFVSAGFVQDHVILRRNIG